MGRPNWYYDHPPTCNCAACTEQRIQSAEKVTPKAIFRRLKKLFGGRK
jgi:hypothetical protein